MKKRNSIFWLRIIVWCLGITVVFCLMVIGMHIFGGLGNMEDSLPWAQALLVLWIPFTGCLTALRIRQLIEHKKQEHKEQE